MKYAFYPGCVAKGACPELKMATEITADALGIELVELKEAACTGAGVISEHSPYVSDTLNARTFAMAEKLKLPLMNICSTCQGNMSEAQKNLKDKDRLDTVNKALKEEGLEYKDNLSVKNFMWILVEDYGLDKLKSLVKKPLSALKVAPFYGCYIVRPVDTLDINKQKPRDRYLEKIIDVLGGELVDYSGKDKCCGFPIQSMNKKNSFTMAGNHLSEAKGEGASCMVTPCPLCHLNLDANQKEVGDTIGEKIDMPVLHLPQMVGLALGIDPIKLGLNKNIIDTKEVVAALG